jgi:hypothetical protein
MSSGDVIEKLPQTSPDNILTNGLKVFFIFMGIIAVFMIVYSGVQYIVSAGDRTKIETAKKTLLYSVVGLLVSMLAFALVEFVFKGVTGAPLL